MSLTRAALNTAVTGELAGVLTQAGFTNVDSTTNMKEPLDSTFRALGVAEAGLGAATVADGAEQKAIAFLRYFVVDKAVWNTADEVNMKASGGTGANLREGHENLLKLLAHALAVAQSFGLQVPGNGQSGYIPVPFGGGISKADYEARADDTSRMPPLFSTRDLPTPSWGEPW